MGTRGLSSVIRASAETSGALPKGERLAGFSHRPERKPDHGTQVTVPLDFITSNLSTFVGAR